ncbi:YihY/virulence factor BrkB family protein [Streptomyces sp. NPDC001414]
MGQRPHGTLKEFKDDELADRAAALTYYGVLSLFPALLALVSLLGAGKSATDTVLNNFNQFAPGSARTLITGAVEQMQGNAAAGSVRAGPCRFGPGDLVGVRLRGGVLPTSNAVYDMPEGRPVWKVLPVRVGVTVVLMVPAVISALIVVFTGSLARRAGQALGVGDTALTVWSIAKWWLKRWPDERR